MTSPRLYSVGTVAVTNGSKIVTFTGTIVAEFNMRDGDDLQVLGRGSRIAIADLLPDTNQVELLHDFDGETGSALAYTIYRNPAGWGAQELLAYQVADNVRLLSEGVPIAQDDLDAIAAARAETETLAGEAAQSATDADTRRAQATLQAANAADSADAAEDTRVATVALRDDVAARAALITSTSPESVVGAATPAEMIGGAINDKVATPANTKAVLDDRYGPLQGGALAPESGWRWAVADSSGQIAIAVDANGKIWLNLREDSTVPEAALASMVREKLLQGLASELFTVPESGWLMALTDSEGSVGWGLRPNGTFWARLADDVVLPANVLSNLIDMVTANFLPSQEIVCWGDSMTAGAGGSGTTYPGVLAAALGRTVATRGVGGQGSAAIATRQGGLPMLVTVESNQIPASGSVAVTDRSQTPITNQGPSSFSGVLAGVPGILAASTEDGGATYAYTFSRSDPGDVVSCPPESQFVFDYATAGAAQTAIIWSGRNDAKATRANIRDIRDHILAMVDHLTVRQKRFLVVSICNGGAAEGSGSGTYTQIAAANAELAETFGDHFVDLRSYMVNQAIHDAGLTPTGDDTTDMAADGIPLSLRNDGIHFNAAGYTQVGQFLARQIIARGW